MSEWERYKEHLRTGKPLMRSIPLEVLVQAQIERFIRDMSEQNKPLWAKEGVTLSEEAKREIVQGMRDSEELAYRLFRANRQYVGTAPDCIPEWEAIGEYLQKSYLLEANAAIEWLFEHGRIAKYIPSHEALEAMHGQFKTYLAMKALDKMDKTHE